MTEIDVQAFDAFEAAGWELAAGAYDRFFGEITTRVIDPLLDAAGISAGNRVLDLATGPGYVAGRAAERGGTAVGVDVAESMVAAARQRHPTLHFERASVTELPFPDKSFDSAVGNFLVLHLGAPERAVGEAARVLVPGGGIALSTWDAPDRARLFGAVLDAIADAGVAPPSDVPLGHSFFRFADDTEFRNLLVGSGFADVGVETVAYNYRLSSANELHFAMLEGTVRTAALLRAASETEQDEVRRALERRLAPYRSGSGFDVPVSVKIASGVKLR